LAGGALVCRCPQILKTISLPLYCDQSTLAVVKAA
jgi:hypothetical protein